jgi:hypothetical protein
MTRRVLRAMLDEARNGPRLFLLSPVDPTHGWNLRNLMQEELLLTLYCEHPGHEHELGTHGQIRIRNPLRWIAQVTPYALLSLKVLRIALPVAIGAIGLAEDAVKDRYEADFKFTDSWVKAASEVKGKIEEAGERYDRFDYPSLSHAEGAGLRAFHQLLAAEHGSWQPGDAVIGPTVESDSNEPILRRVVDKKTGDVLWVCPRHYREYDPGLPVIPEQTSS